IYQREVPYQAAKEGFFPSFFTKTNKKGSPIYSLRLTNIMSQVFLFSTLSGTIAEAYTFVITVSTLAYLIPYLVSPIFQLKLVATGETYKNEMRARITDGIVAVIALCYALWVIKTGASDIKTFLLGIGLFVIGFAFYPLMNRDQKKNNEKKKRANCVMQLARFSFRYFFSCVGAYYYAQFLKASPSKGISLIII
ncbi:amino acid permease, partial [Bacillus sp. HC-Mk]